MPRGIRTGLAALASGVGARALMKDIVASWLGNATASILIGFSAFCFAAAIWRDVSFGVPRLKPDIRRLPAALTITMNGFLIFVALAALIGVWITHD